MSERDMTPDERLSLLRELGRLSTDADYLEDISRVFLPLPRHTLALRREYIVIRGERGAGKTALFRFLTTAQDQGDRLHKLFSEARIPDSQWISGFSEHGVEHPSPVSLDAFGHQVTDGELRIFWLVHLVCRLMQARVTTKPLPGPVWEMWSHRRNEPKAWIEAAHEHLGAIVAWMDSIEAEFASQDRSIFVVYDHLDKIGSLDRELRHRFAGTLLALWMSHSHRYRSLRAKIFVREDIFEASQQLFADASKLRSRSIALDWDKQSLFRLLIRHMAELSEDMRSWIQRTERGIPLTHSELLGWLPPEQLPETGQISQKSFVEHLAGEQMGKGVKKGYVYRWIPNRLQDAHTRIMPRSILSLVGLAAEKALELGPQARYDRLLHPTELSGALEQTSQRRAAELAEEHRVVERLNRLRGHEVMLDAKVVCSELAQPPAEDDGFGYDGQAVMEELIRLGVLSVRRDGRIDIPDLYRYGFDIRRKGGVKRPA